MFRVKVGEGEGLPFENDGDTPIFLSIKVSLRVVGKKKIYINTINNQRLRGVDEQTL